MSTKMSNHSFPRPNRKKEDGTILVEALIASAVMVVVFAAVIPLFLRHLELARRARDLDLVEAVVNRDINTYRHYSRFWQAFSGPYSTEILRQDITIATPSVQNNGKRPMTYAPGGNCFTWDDQFLMQRSMASDISSYVKFMPGGIDLGLTQNLGYKLFDQVPGYRIKRFVQSVSALSFNALVIRLTYRVEPVSNNFPSLSFNRVAEIPIEAQYWC